jgi:hypothetical protein
MSLIAIGAVVVFLASVIGDATIGAVLAGLFSLVNTFLLVSLRGQHNDLRRVMTADRRIVFNEAGRPIGTVLDLQDDPEWEDWAVQMRRRHDDPAAPSPPIQP